MKNSLIGIFLVTLLSSYAFSSESGLKMTKSLKQFDGKWVMTDTFCNSSQRGDLIYWSSSFLEIKNGNVESRVSGPNCMTLENIIYSETESKGDILVYEEVNAIQISKLCFKDENRLFESEGDEVKAVKSKLYINKNKQTEIFQVMPDVDCGEGKGMTAIYSKFE